MNIQKPGSFLRYLIPQYDEIVLFTMSFTCLLLLMSGITANYEDIKLIPPTEYDPRMIAAALVFIAGLMSSLYHAFIKRQKTLLEKSFMLFFAVLVNAFSGLMAGGYDLTGTKGWLIVFPVFNMINSITLLFMWRAGIINESNISDRYAPGGQVALAAAIVFVLYYLCAFVFKLLWIQTLSICLFYATNLIKLMGLLVFRFFPIKSSV